MKKRLLINNENLAKQLETDNSYNWIVVTGIELLKKGEKLGSRMTDFLLCIGVVEYSKY